MAAEITHIDFDGAVDLTIKFFGNSPLNRVFLAEYIGNFYVTEAERRVQVTPQDMSLRVLSAGQDFEKVFWMRFDGCYLLNPLRYSSICLYYLEYFLENSNATQQRAVQALLADGLTQDAQFFFPKDYAEMRRARFNELDRTGSAVFKTVHDYLNPQSSNTVGAPWESTHIRPADFRQRLATGHQAILLGVLQSCVNTLPVLDKAPFLITICQKDNQTGVPNYTKWTQLLTAEKSGKVFGAQSYNGSSGHAFWLAQQFGSQPHYVGQWKFELFYANVWAMFVKFLGHYIGDIRYRRSDNPSYQLTLSEKWTGKAQNGDQFLSKNSMANVQILFKIASAFSVYKQQKSMTAEEIRNITFEHSRQQRQFERAQGKKVGSRFFTS